jgi:voltage-gated potassium channel
MDQTRVERWERSAQLPLMAVSLLFVAAYAWPILDPGPCSGRSDCCAC